MFFYNSWNERMESLGWGLPYRKITEVYECKRDSDGIYQGKGIEEKCGKQ